ncbi:hypothetical protein MHC_01345 [Mycoplasma haemocanis str. Illinois]|uniref:Uncharacterized protein n=1 Tax=Mycoplasma haemocanis (strain Illinois) TaxID=1111676 RepID=H6N663_MYCHN|nr:hypothetical protein [Mycoplasma haemocanis]AEW45135.1 hypothetical protein MHC_01345 [Mycoplasma haemocanis str. Illinois]
MTPLFKVVLGFSSVGTITTGALYVSGIFKNRVKKIAIYSLLNDANPEKRLITSKAVEDDVWKKAYMTYRTENKSLDKDIWNLKDWNKPSNPVIETNATEEFISKCEFNSKVKVTGTDDLLYRQVLAYCTRDTLVSDLIKEGTTGRTLLTNTSSDEDWKAVWNTYKSSNEVASGGIDKWKFSDWSEKKGGDTLPTEYKARCSEKASEPAFKTTDIKYLDVLNWCSK